MKPSLQAPARPAPRALPATAAIGLFVAGAVLAEPDRVDPDTGAGTWEVQTEGVKLSMTQLLPDQVRAFYVNRGFELEDAELFATACVFMTVMRNESAPGVIEFRLTDWAVEAENRPWPLPTIGAWLEQWEARDVPDAARLAFRWAQFPGEQRYAAGEWNQGMLAVGLDPDTRFDLTARWTLNDTTHEGSLHNVRCAK